MTRTLATAFTRKLPPTLAAFYSRAPTLSSPESILTVTIYAAGVLLAHGDFAVIS
jgi:hypothetical protein